MSRPRGAAAAGRAERGAEQGKGWHRAPGTLPAPRGLLSPAVRALAGEGRTAAAPPRPAAAQPGSYFVRRVAAEAGLGPPGAPAACPSHPPAPCSVSPADTAKEAPVEKPCAPSPIVSPRIAGGRGDGRGRTSLCRRRGLSDLQSFVPGGNRSISLVGFMPICM